MPNESEPECLELLNEFVKAFQSIPQRYCLFCEANAGLGMEAHKPDCPFRRASELIKTAPTRNKKAPAKPESLADASPYSIFPFLQGRSLRLGCLSSLTWRLTELSEMRSLHQK